MKAKVHHPRKSETLRLWTKRIPYRWSTPDGAVHHGSTVLVARNRHELPKVERNFWFTNTHVAPEAI